MSLEEHLSVLLGQVRPLEPLDITLKEAIGCQLVGDVVAPRPLPHFATCAVAGYAVRAGDLGPPAPVKVVDEVAPGYAATQPVFAGVAVRVAPGSPLPGGADAVVAGPPVAVGDSVTLGGPVAPGDGVVAVGSVASQGSVVLPSGSMMDPLAVGLLATLGQVRVAVRPRPRVVVVSVGNDLMDLGDPATPGLVYDAGGPMLAAAAEQAGAVSFRVGPIEYDARPIADSIDDQLIRADLIVVTGPIESRTSLVRQQLDRLGSVSFDEGSTSLGAFGHGTVGDEAVAVLALPGNPVSAAMMFHVLAVPMICAMRGVPAPATVQVRLAGPWDRALDLTQLVPARVAPDGTATPLVRSGASLAALVQADVLLRILPGTGQQPAGSALPALPLRLDRR